MGLLKEEKELLCFFHTNYIALYTSKVRICYATGHYSVVDLATLFDLSAEDVREILRGCG